MHTGMAVPGMMITTGMTTAGAVPTGTEVLPEVLTGADERERSGLIEASTSSISPVKRKRRRNAALFCWGGDFLSGGNIDKNQLFPGISSTYRENITNILNKPE